MEDMFFMDNEERNGDTKWLGPDIRACALRRGRRCVPGWTPRMA